MESLKMIPMKSLTAGWVRCAVGADQVTILNRSAMKLYVAATHDNKYWRLAPRGH
jgi:hypothetical protein